MFKKMNSSLDGKINSMNSNLGHRIDSIQIQFEKARL